MLAYLRKIFISSNCYKKQTTDYEKVAYQYKYWRIRIFYSIYVGYVFYYFTRKSVTFALPLLSEKLNLNMTQLGMLSTLLYITYGISKFFSGIISDQVNPRYFMSIGLFMTGVCNIIFGCSSSLLVFSLVWAANGIFQGFGWPPCTKQLTYWFSKKERGRWWSLNSTSHNVGGALIPIFVAWTISQSGDWRPALWGSGIVAIICSFWLIERMRDNPQSLGLPTVEQYKNEPPIKEKTNTKNLSSKNLLIKILKNKTVWLLAICYFFVYVIRTGINDWMVIYLIKEKGYTLTTAASSVLWFEIGGFFGIIAAGWVSDRIFSGKRIPYITYSSLAIIPVLYLIYSLKTSSVFLTIFLFTIVGFLIFGPQLLVGLAAAEFVDKNSACAANGFAGWFAYIGAASAGYPLGKIIDKWSWDGLFIILILCSIITTVILIPLQIKSSKVKTKDYLIDKSNTTNTAKRA